MPRSDRQRAHGELRRRGWSGSPEHRIPARPELTMHPNHRLAARVPDLALLDDDSGALSIQVLQEFYVQATRTSRADAVPHELAAGLIEAWSRFRIQDMTLAVLNVALRIRKT